MAGYLLILTLLVFQSNIRGYIADLVSSGKTADSSTFEFFEPSNALDGNDVPYVSQMGCFLSELGANPWWKVDLGKEFEITKVVIINAIDDKQLQYGLLGGMVLVGNADFNNRFENAQCGGDITFEQLNNSALVELKCSPPTNGMYVFVTANGFRIALCEVLVYSSIEEVAQNDLPLNPNGLWPLNSFYTIYDLSGFREYDASTTKFMFTNTSSGNVAFADLSPVDGMAASILIYNHGRFGSGTDFTFMFEIRPGPYSDGDIISIGDLTISQTNSGERMYSSEIEVTSNGTLRVRGVVFNSEAWTSIAVVSNGSTGKVSLWRNGCLVQARDSLPQVRMSWNNLKIGFPGRASGSVRNVHIYSRALTQQELAAALTIPLEGQISRKIATSLVSKMHSVGSNLFESAYSATFASGHVTKSVTVRSMYDCAFSCLDELLCNGYAFNKEHTQCVVGIGFVDKRDLVESNDWLFYKYVQAV